MYTVYAAKCIQTNSQFTHCSKETAWQQTLKPAMSSSCCAWRKDDWRQVSLAVKRHTAMMAASFTAQQLYAVTIIWRHQVTSFTLVSGALQLIGRREQLQWCMAERRAGACLTMDSCRLRPSRSIHLFIGGLVRGTQSWNAKRLLTPVPADRPL